jgi:hypothetical protein
MYVRTGHKTWDTSVSHQSALTSTTIHHGPDPDMALSKYAGREEAAADAARLVAERI